MMSKISVIPLTFTPDEIEIVEGSLCDRRLHRKNVLDGRLTIELRLKVVEALKHFEQKDKSFSLRQRLMRESGIDNGE